MIKNTTSTGNNQDYIPHDTFLCGGVFLTILSNNFRSKNIRRRGFARRGVTIPNFMIQLIKLADPSWNQNEDSTRFSEEVSRYKTCKINDNLYLPFTEELGTSFDEQLKNAYNDSIAMMCAITDVFFSLEHDGDKISRLLLAIIENDPSIDDNAIFYIGYNGEGIRKKDIFSLKEIHIQQFLLGLWHYIITNNIDNTNGQKCIKAITRRKGDKGSEYTVVDHIGNSKNYDIRAKTMSVVPPMVRRQRESIYNDMGIKLPQGTMNIYSSNTNSFFERANARMVLSEDEFKDYLAAARSSFETVKTLLYTDGMHKFRDFYVCNDLEVSNRFTGSGHLRNLKNVTNSMIMPLSRACLITGTGGLGKSMMMQHLMLDAIDTYTENRRIPIFVTLRHFGENFDNLTDLIYDRFSVFDKGQHKREFDDLLESGCFEILLDGLDEIATEYRPAFEKQLDDLTDRYPANLFLMSSRPSPSVLGFRHFITLSLCPFTKEQALQMIDNLEYDEKLKEAFRDKLSTKLYLTHRPFAENPLLLTIMLITFEENGLVQSQMYLFYRDAYMTLAQKHDALKTGFRRKFATQLTADGLRKYLREFCAQTYYREEYEFSEDDIISRFDKLNIVVDEKPAFTGQDFLTDIADNICLLYLEGRKYRFIHRSFQEYFSADYFINQLDENLYDIAMFFENQRSRMYNDATFDMMYEMGTQKIEKNVILPFLNDLYKKCENENGYKTFLITMYPKIQYFWGDVLDSPSNAPASYLYGFISRKIGFSEDIDYYSFDDEDDFLLTEYVKAYEDFEFWEDEGDVYERHSDDETLMDRDDLTSEYIDHFGEPDTEGALFEFDVENVLENEDFYANILSDLVDENFPLYKEYLAGQDYLRQLRTKYASRGKVSNLFEKLH